MKNDHGLSRHIPEDVKREVRQRSRFGCVIPGCRRAFYEYEHIEPEFKDAKSHDPAAICLVCPNHNPRRTGGLGQENYSKEQILKYYNDIQNAPEHTIPDIVNPDFFSGFSRAPKIIMGRSSFQGVRSIINVAGEDVFSFRRSDGSTPFEPDVVFTGNFKSEDGGLLFSIVENEWRSRVDHWDVETKNGEIKVYRESGISFHAIKKPSDAAIEIVYMKLWHPPFLIEVSDGRLFVVRVDQAASKYMGMEVEADFLGGECGVFIDPQDIVPDIAFYGFYGQGPQFTLKGNGICLARGGASAYLRKLDFIHSSNIENKAVKTIKSIEPPSGKHYFVVGELEEKIIDMPLWKETEYYLNGQRLMSKPYSWGHINETEELFHIASNEREDLALNSGFIGFYADDVLEKDWFENVFEVMVESHDEDGSTFNVKVKISDIAGRKVVKKKDELGRPLVPQKYAGCSPWEGE
jgi:hypothetical protein